MAKPRSVRKSAKKKAGGKVAKKAAKKSARKAAKKAPKKAPKKAAAKGAKKASRKPAKKSANKRPTARRPKRAAAPAPAAVAPMSRLGVITHTELASTDPSATRTWCEDVLGWAFGEAMPTPTGPYHMWRFDNGAGGGIRGNNPPEVPGSIPYVEVANIHDAFSRALEAGASEMFRPEALPGDSGWIAIVAAPGGVAIGFWAKE